MQTTATGRRFGILLACATAAGCADSSGTDIAGGEDDITGASASKKLSAELFADAERSLKRNLVLRAIADAEGFEVSADEVRAEIEAIAQTSDDPRRTARDAMSRDLLRALGDRGTFVQFGSRRFIWL